MKFSQTSVMCSIMVGLSPHQILAPVSTSYRELKYGQVARNEMEFLPGPNMIYIVPEFGLVNVP